MMKLILVLMSCLASSVVDSFAPLPTTTLRRSNFQRTHQHDCVQELNLVKENSSEAETSRRDFFTSTAAALVGGVLTTTTAAATRVLPMPLIANAASNNKVLVLGGTGFVGSRVVAQLKSTGVEVVATSRDGRDGTIALDFTKESGDGVQQKVKDLASGCSAVISCIGAIGTPNDEAVNAGTGFAAMGAKNAGVDRFVYISVAPEVKDFAKDIDFLKGYMAGKTFSQDSIVSKFQQYTLIEPTFIYGGGEFKVNPPRVAGFYGSFIEGLLSSGPIRALTNVAPEGFIKIALEPPVSVDDVAKASVAGALGKAEMKELDTYDKIKDTAKLA